jgi:hypothetical protein
VARELLEADSPQGKKLGVASHDEHECEEMLG